MWVVVSDVVVQYKIIRCEIDSLEFATARVYYLDRRLEGLRDQVEYIF